MITPHLSRCRLPRQFKAPGELARRGKRRRRPHGTRRGLVMATFAIGMVALLTVVGMAIDLSLLIVYCQPCQTVADGAALAGAQELPRGHEADVVAQNIAQANLPSEIADDYTITTQVYLEDEKVPNYGPASERGAIGVVASKCVPFHFLRVIGNDGSMARRAAVAIGSSDALSITPMWIWSLLPARRLRESGWPKRLHRRSNGYARNWAANPRISSPKTPIWDRRFAMVSKM